jgi:hypothetical protein
MSVGPTGRQGVAKGSFGSQLRHTRKEDDAVHGPSLTPQEAVASVARRVRGAEAQGLDREQAIRRVSIETGLDPEKVRWSVETVFGAAPVRISPPPRRRRGAFAIAAAL